MAPCHCYLHPWRNRWPPGFERRVSILSKIRIFGAVNHIGNQYEMLKLAEKYDVEFTYLENNVRRWSRYSPRPMPDHLKWATHYEPGKYDVAILHVDQQHTDPNIGKGWLYRDLNEVIQDIPKIVINHGTPMWDEYYTEDLVINGGEVLTNKGRKRLVGMKEKIGDNFMVVNSYDAVNRWGWGYPLIHGMSPNEWYDLPKEPRVVIALSPGGLDKYYNRQLLTAIKGAVKEKTGLDVVHIQINYEARDWEDYKEFLGSSLLYINPTLDSPMPRARTEAMLSGCCVLTSPYHGANEFISQGRNGFIVPDNPLSYANTIDKLLNEVYSESVRIGQAGKQTARKLFSIDRYLDDLYHVVYEVSNGRRPEWDGHKIWDTDTNIAASAATSNGGSK
jgi:glycosyltransferase involved in cell wall biosynthesis